MRLAKMISLYLAANNITQKSAAESIGISESTLSRVISGNGGFDSVAFLKVINWCSSIDTWDNTYDSRLSAVETAVKSMKPAVMWNMPIGNKLGGSFGNDS